jgi:hypothetical protein
MKSQYTPFARKVRQFKHLSKKLNSLIESGAFFELSEEKQRKLVYKLRHLYHKLRQVFSGKQLRRTLAGAAMLLGLTFSSQAQNFGSEVTTPFNWPNDVPFSLPSAVDIDNDGDFDIVNSSLESLNFNENIGTPTAPDFTGASVTNPFGLTSTYIFAPAFADMDDDGDLDLLLGGEGGNFIFHENTGTAESPSFAAGQTNPYGLTGIYYFALPSLIDIDNDGDYDLLATEAYGDMFFFENTGTTAAPAFAAPVANPFGIGPDSNNSILRAPAFADVDNDCDLDLMFHSYDISQGEARMYYLENLGTPEIPDFGTPVSMPSGIFFDGYYLAQPTFADIDADGDQDLLVGTYAAYGGLSFFENLLDNGNPAGEDATISVNASWPYYFSMANFSIMDPDGDDLEAIRITSLPATGTLNYDGNPVTAGQEIAASDLGLLQYVPEAGTTGTAIASFDFQASDGTLFDCDGATITIDAFLNTGTNQQSLATSILLMPNPASGIVQLQATIPNSSAPVDIRVTDMLGRITHQLKVGGMQNQVHATLDVSGLTTGMYLVQLSSGNKISTTRLMVE